MSVQGIILIDLLGLGFAFWILNLVRTKRLYVSYAVIWLMAIGGAMVIISIPPLLYLIPIIVGAIFPASALSLLAFAFIFMTLIFFSVQISQISARQAELAQAVALKELLIAEESTAPPSDPTGQEG